MSLRVLTLGGLLALAGCGPGQPPHEPEPPTPQCQRDDQCAAGMQCKKGSCVDYQGEPGDPCYDVLDCTLDLECEAGVCIEPPVDP